MEISILLPFFISLKNCRFIDMRMIFWSESIIQLVEAWGNLLPMSVLFQLTFDFSQRITSCIILIIKYWVFCCLQWTSYLESGWPFCYKTPPPHTVLCIFTTIHHLITFIRKYSADIARCVRLVYATPFSQFQDILQNF